jgi:hypothetical protein
VPLSGRTALSRGQAPPPSPPGHPPALPGARWIAAGAVLAAGVAGLLPHGQEALDALRPIRCSGRGTDRHIPIVALTAHDEKEDGENSREAGMDGYPAKPVQPRRLLEAIREPLAPRDTAGGRGTV